MKTPTANFTMALTRNPKANTGRLVISEESANIAYAAKSGLDGYQYMDAYAIPRKGYIPPSGAINNQYYISTKRLWLPDVVGVEGSFYPIAPFEVLVNGSVRRGNFGVHFDANIPGSSGCIVITLQDHWNQFRAAMARYAEDGIRSLPLTVRY